MKNTKKNQWQNESPESANQTHSAKSRLDSRSFIVRYDFNKKEIISEENVTKYLGLSKIELTMEKLYSLIPHEYRDGVINYDKAMRKLIYDADEESRRKFLVTSFYIKNYPICNTSGNCFIVNKVSIVESIDSHCFPTKIFEKYHFIRYWDDDYIPNPIQILDEDNIPLIRQEVLLEKLAAQYFSKIALSPKEKEVCRYILKGFESKVIAEILEINKQTLNKHRGNIIAKGKLIIPTLKTAIEVAIIAKRQGVLKA